MTATATIATLKKRSEFVRVRGGGRATAPAFVLEGKRREANPGAAVCELCGPRFGFTITKKIGNAVVRNRIRRRLRAALSQVFGANADPQMDYVIVARLAAASQEFSVLVKDLTTAFGRVHGAGRAAKPR